jgi:hypothetical protein
MEDEFRSMLTAELAEADPPPLGDLAEASVRQGRRMRTWRRVRDGGVAAVAVLAVAGGAVGVSGAVGGAGSHHDRGTVAAAPAAAPGTVPATPEGMMELLTSLLPPGTTSGYAYGAGELAVQAYLDRGHGAGMLRVTMTQGSPGSLMNPGTGEDGVEVGVPHRVAGGDIVRIDRIPSNCVQSTVVYVQHTDGVIVMVELGSCLAWNGHTNPPGTTALTDDEAVALASDSRWNPHMDVSLVTQGAVDFPHLPTYS